MNVKAVSTSEAYRLANEGLVRLMFLATGYITDERQNLERANQSEIKFLRTRQGFLQGIWQGLVEEVTVHHRRTHQAHSAGSGAWNLSVAVGLIVGAFLFTVKTIEPFALGWMGWAYCIALAVTLPYSLDCFLQDFRHRAVKRILVSATLITSLTTALLFGMLRGDVLAHSLSATPAVVIDTLGPLEPSGDSTETERFAATLRLLWSLAALAFELAAGIALHTFRENRRASDFGTLRRLQKELLKVERELLRTTQRLHELLSQPARVEAAFWANFERGLHDGRSRQAVSRRLACVVLAAILSPALIQAADKLQIIVALDLSKTQEAINYSGKAEFRENVRAVSTILANVLAGSRITVIAISDRSYVNPLILLEARTSPDPGAFSSRLISGRRMLISEWKKRLHSLKPSFNKTDVFGALRYAGDLFARSDAERKVLVLLTDGRNYAAELDLETPKVIDVEWSLRQVEKQELFATLMGVEVLFLGIGDHSGKRGIKYAGGLKTFWARFVQRSGGTLRVFSPGREPDAIALVTNESTR